MIVFCFHRFNDLDHMAPIGYKLARDSSEKVAFLSLNPNYDISRDIRLNFLRTHNVLVDYIYNYNSFFLIRYLLIAIYKSMPVERIKLLLMHYLGIKRLKLDHKQRFLDILSGLFSTVIRKICYRPVFEKLLLRYYFNERWAKKLFDTLKPSILIFDHSARPGLYVVGPLRACAEQSGIATVSVPHAVLLYSEDHRYVVRSYLTASEANMDHIILTHHRWKNGYRKRGFDDNKIHVLGSARYCREWFGVLNRIVPRMNLQDDGNEKLKVVFMERQTEHGAYKPLVEKAVEGMHNLNFVNLLIQPTTRSHTIYFENRFNGRIIRDSDSVSICRWADVVICLSSILIEVLLQGKVFINAKFLHGETLLCEEFGVGWTVYSYEELVDALKRIRDNPGYKGYSDENVNRFLIEMVYGNKENSNILSDYRDFILGTAKKI